MLHISVGFALWRRPYMRTSLQGVLDFAQHRPHWRVIPDVVIDYQAIAAKPPDGIISGVQDDNLEHTRARTMPCVTLEPLGLTLDLPWIGPDYAVLGRLAVDYFTMRGIRSLLYFRGRDPDLIDARLIGEGAADAAEKHSAELSVFAVGPRTRATGRWTLEDQAVDLIECIRSMPDPVGVICSDDKLGWVALEACLQHGVRVPDHAAVLGIGNADFICDVCRPTLSSIAIDHRQIGHRAAALLDRQLAGQKVHRRTLIDNAEVITRQSTSHIASDDRDVAAAVRYISEHLSEAITVDDLADAALVSKRTLLRRFNSELGRSPSDEVRRQRIEKAKRLLRDTDMPLASLALETGFGQQSALGRAIKADCGKTPAQLRREFAAR